MENHGLHRNIDEDAAMGPSARSGSADRPVLVAVDLSSASEDAVVWACKHANHIDAPLFILHVVHEPADAPGFYKSGNGDLLEPNTDIAERALAEFRDRVEYNHPELANLRDAEAVCVSGLPGQRILDAANAQDAQLLVLGGHHRNKLQRLIHGSTAGQVIQHAVIPVTVVNAES